MHVYALVYVYAGRLGACLARGVHLFRNFCITVSKHMDRERAREKREREREREERERE